MRNIWRIGGSSFVTYLMSSLLNKARSTKALLYLKYVFLNSSYPQRMFHSCNWGRWIESQIKLCIYLHKFPIPTHTHTHRERRRRNFSTEKYIFSAMFMTPFSTRNDDPIFLPIFCIRSYFSLLLFFCPQWKRGRIE